MTPEEYTILLNTAADLEANTLFTTLASTILPQDLQFKTGSHLLPPILDYFLENLAIPFTSPKGPKNTVFVAHTTLIKISPNGQSLLTNDRYDNSKSLLWNLNTQQTAGVLNTLNNIDFSAAATYIISYVMNNYFIYDCTSGKKAFDINNSNCITFSPDDQHCLYNSTSTPGIINIKSHKDANWVDAPSLQGHTAHVNTIQFSPDGNYIVSGSNDEYPNNLILWDGKIFQKITNLVYEGPWSAHIYPVVHAHFTPDNKYIISKDNQENSIVWDVASKKPVAKLDCQNKVLWHVDNQTPTFRNSFPSQFTYNPYNLHKYINHRTNQKILYDLTINRTFNHSVLPVNKNAISTLTSNPTKKMIICSTFSSNPPFEFKKEINIRTSNYNVEYAVESSDSQYLLVLHNSGHITLRLADTGRLLEIPVYPYNAVKFSPNNDYIIITHPPTVPNDRMFTIWNMDDLKMMIDVCYDFSITLPQSRFLYRLYLARINEVKIIIDQNDSDYEVYKSLSTNLKSLVDRFLPFEITQNA